MYTLILENEKGKRIELTHNVNYDIMSIEGLNPPEATINTNVSANFDGSRFNSSRVNNRNVVITFAINGPAEQNRHALYEVVKSKHFIRMYYKTEMRNVYVDGYVQTFEIQYFDQKQTGQISVLCPKPYFKEKSISDVAFSSVVSDFEFPFSIPEEGIEFSHLELGVEKSVLNMGDVSVGVIMKLRAVGDVVRPRIYNVDSREFMIVNVSMSAGDELVIDTNTGSKSIELTRADGTTTNEINNLQRGSKWFQLESGDNVFLYEADSAPENLTLEFIHQNQYGGV